LGKPVAALYQAARLASRSTTAILIKNQGMTELTMAGLENSEIDRIVTMQKSYAIRINTDGSQ